jgi:hypothetical protein
MQISCRKNYAFAVLSAFLLMGAEQNLSVGYAAELDCHVSQSCSLVRSTIEKPDIEVPNANPSEANIRILIASPDSFNPSLYIPPPPPATLRDFILSPEPEPPIPSYAKLDSLTINFRNDSDNFNQRNQIFESTFRWLWDDGSVLLMKTGYNSFDLEGITSVRNIPLQIGWEQKLGSVNLLMNLGIDTFDSLPTTVNFDATTNLPILPGVTIFGFIEQKPYKFNAATLNNQIATRRFGPNIYWQIDPSTSFFSLYRWGNYNDNNNEQQSFSRLERKLGEFSLAANLFTWAYDRNAQPTSGYFSPPDFLVYNGELAWEGDIFSLLHCRLATSMGEQRLSGSFAPAVSYQARCTAKISPSIEADLGYTFSNVRSLDTGGSAYNNTSLEGHLRVKF